MHRSGTSALTGVLSLLGADLGSNLMAPDELQNPKGFFENNFITNLNDAILQKNSSAWDDIFFNPTNVEFQNYSQTLIDIIDNQFSESQLFAIKDPRLCLLLPLYIETLKKININFKIVIPLRDPNEVAGSLEVRNKFGRDKSLLLWMQYNLFAESFSRGHPRIFYEFTDLLHSPKSVIEKIDNKFETTLSKNFFQNQHKIKEFLDPNLRHHNSAVQLPKKMSQSIHSELYNTLISDSHKPDHENFDFLLDAVLRVRPPLDAEKLNHLLEIARDQKQERENADLKLRKANDELSIVQNKLMTQKTVIEDTQAALREANIALENANNKITESKVELQYMQVSLKQSEKALVTVNHDLKSSNLNLRDTYETLMLTQDKLMKSEKTQISLEIRYMSLKPSFFRFTKLTPGDWLQKYQT